MTEGVAAAASFSERVCMYVCLCVNIYVCCAYIYTDI